MSFRQRHFSRRFSGLAHVGESLVRLWRPLLVTSLLVTGGTLGMRYLGLMQSAELAAYDQLVRLQPDEEPDKRLLVVGITESDLQLLQEANISDRTLAQTLASLQQHRPQTIAIDVFRDFPHEPGWQGLNQELSQNPNVVIICKASATNDPGTAPPPNTPLENVGFADLVVDPGGILRRSLLIMGTPDYNFPVQHPCNQPNQTLLALSFQAAVRYLDDQGVQMDFTEDGQLVFGSTQVPQIRPRTGGYRRADTSGYQIMLRYRSEKRAVSQVSLMEVLQNRVDSDLIRDRVVFIGYTSPLFKDTFYTPYSAGKDDEQKMPGVVVHAQSTSQLLSAVLDGRPLSWVWPDGVEILWIFAWSVIGGVLGWYVRHPAAVSLVLLLGSGVVYLSCALLFTQGGWIPLIPAALTFVGTAVGVVLLDRFNNSAYGQQVYRSVKNLLHLDIEIDEEKLEKQVTEITETDYFRELQDSVSNLRHPDALPEVLSEVLSEAAIAPTASCDCPDYHPDDQTGNHPDGGETDYWQTLKQQSQAIKAEVTDSAASNGNDSRGVLTSMDSRSADSSSLDLTDTSGVTDAAELGQTSTDYEFDFIQQLTQQAQQLKRSLDGEPAAEKTVASPQPTDASTSQPARCFVPFTLDVDFCEYADVSSVTHDHMTYLVAEARMLRTVFTAIAKS